MDFNRKQLSHMVSGVILAGGKSSRMKRDKAFIEFKGEKLINIVGKTFSEFCDEVIVSVAKNVNSKDYKKKINFNSIVVNDKEEGKGPLIGILSSFKVAKGEYIAISSCDSPFIKRQVYEFLMEKAKGKDGAVVKVKKGFEPLHAVYKRKEMINATEKVIKEKKASPINAFKFLNLVFVPEEEIRKIDKNLKTFININTEDDLKKFEK